uniref:Uncharacterized protein n=1 Tax=Arundo donax TaxID=35708 RepID=A0A0A9DQD2_ARUDO
MSGAACINMGLPLRSVQAPAAASQRLGKPVVGAGMGAMGAAEAYRSSSSARLASIAQTWLHKRVGWGSAEADPWGRSGGKRGPYVT